MKRILAPLILLALASSAHAAAPLAHASTTCSDYSNQAAAQRAADTRDTDGDGVYCESLPCPCLRPGQTTTPRPRVHRRRHRRAPALFAGPCKRGRLPDPSCSPGEAMTSDATAVCAPGYSRSVRAVSEATKRAVYLRYGIRRHSAGQYEVDHVIPLELGGSNSSANLFPEAAAPRPGFHEKDRLENALHEAVCNGDIGLSDAQRIIASDWTAAYRRFFGG